MEPQMTESNNGGAGGFLSSCRELLRPAVDRLGCAVARFSGKLARIARDDPRRVAHSLKVGLALTLVSVFYYVTPLFNGWGYNTIRAVITVVFVMEFTVGRSCIDVQLVAGTVWRFGHVRSADLT
jgi:hypothetical protein